MKKVRYLISLLLVLTLILCACGNGNSVEDTNEAEGPAGIYLCGEYHSDETSLKKELERWEEFYAKGARHLFIEDSYAWAEFLNIWMHEKSDDILDKLWVDIAGTQGGTQVCYDFFKTIKEKFPETIFHGTDVGHQYNTTGERYLRYLEDKGMKDSEEYRITEGNIEQGKEYYSMSGEKEADNYRENCMVENFIRECNKVPGEFIMGIYGDAHISSDVAYYGTVPSMRKQLEELYKDILETEAVWYADVIRTEKVIIGEKEYDADYYGLVDISSWCEGYISREFWLLKGAYDDFKTCRLTGDVLPADNYPMAVEVHQVYMIKYTTTDGEIETYYYRSDGNTWNGQDATEEFVK